MITTLTLGMTSRSTWTLKPLGPDSKARCHTDRFEKILLISSVFNVEFEDFFPMKWLRLVIVQKFPNSKDTATTSNLDISMIAKVYSTQTVLTISSLSSINFYSLIICFCSLFAWFFARALALIYDLTRNHYPGFKYGKISDFQNFQGIWKT